MKKSLFSLALCMCMLINLFAGLSFSAGAEETVDIMPNETNSEPQLLPVEEPLFSDYGTCGENVTWTLDDNGVLTISGTGAMRDYSPPATLWNGYSSVHTIVIEQGVTSIGDAAFFNCIDLTSVTIPSSVTKIGREAFEWCENLTSVTIPSSVMSIGSNAFYACDSLTNVTISEGVQSIGEYAFCSCDGLTSITIPSSVASINEGAFTGCGNLASVTMLDGVETIGNRAFFFCTKLTDVTIPASVATICDDAFGDTKWLENQGEFVIVNGILLAYQGSGGDVTIPEGVSNINASAFMNCESLTSVTIPDGVKRIGDSAFVGCSNLTDVTIPSSVTQICDSAFSHCSNLPSITLPEGIADIADEVFWGCESLTSLTIPSSVTSIGRMAFCTCNGLESMTIPENVTSIGEAAFADCANLKSVTFSSDVLSIGEAAFRDCANLKSVTFSSGITSIGWGAFDFCFNLADVYYEGTEAEWNAVAIEDANMPLLDAAKHFHSHTLTAHAETAATCTTDGNSAYWSCAECGRFFSDEAGTAEIAENSWVRPAGHLYENGKCTRCETTAFEFGSISLVLSGELGLNFYTSIGDTEAVQDGYMLFEIGSKGASQTVYFRDLTPEADGRYVFTCGVNVLQMADTITVTFHFGEDVTVPRTTSVAAYVEKVIEKHGGDDTDATVVLAKSIVNYGHYAQLALCETRGFVLGTDYAVTEALSEVPTLSADTLVRYKAAKTGSVDGILSVSRSVSLDRRTDINLYFTVENGFVPTFTVTDKDGNAVAFLADAEEGRYVLTIPDVFAHELGKTYTVTVNGEMTITVSALSYAYSILGSDRSEAQKKAVSALYAYYQAALDANPEHQEDDDPHSQMTWPAYQALSSAEKKAFIKTFPSASAFNAWCVEAQEKAKNDAVVIGNGAVIEFL